MERGELMSGGLVGSPPGTHAAGVELRHGLLAARAGRLRLGAQHAAQHGHRLHVPQAQVVREADRPDSASSGKTISNKYDKLL